MKVFKFVNAYAVILTILTPAFVHAATIDITNPFKFDTFCGLIVALAQALFVISVAVGTVVIVYAGFLFMTSSGEPGKIKTAKDALFFAILGILVGVSARGIVAVIYNFFGASFSSCS
ncbi:MAG: hypothetical protein UT82_C0009G0007 [Parcubacteria group bacterium GW2011_GWB1_40_14]|nr:MAG: hypothetical protein UT82_C0009G0007 [Parcubacteria group bacterium GW2011_GWB1_40_14]